MDLETALSSLFTLELEGFKIRSRVRWLEEGETPSRFFLNMGDQRREKSYVSSILNSDDVEVYSLEELLRAILQESEAKLGMKNFKSPSIFVWR